MILVGVMTAGLVIMLAAMAWAITQTSVASQDDAKARGDQESGFAWAIAFVSGLIAAFLWCIAVPIAVLLEAGLSRRRESLADASAVQFTRDPGGLRSALEKMAATADRAGGGQPRQRRRCGSTAHCGIQPRRWLNRWLDTHPPIERRIAWLKALEGTP